MMTEYKLNRRDFLRMSAIAAAGVAVAACAKTEEAMPTKPPEAPTATPVPTNTTIPTRAPTATPVPTPVEVKEAPDVAEMVAAGKLPALSERLPQNPLVIQMDWQTPGKYGGRQRTLHDWLGGCQHESMYGNSIVRWVDDGLGIEGGLAEKWEHNDDKSEWTLYFRKGLKWCDGEPWTVDDIMYWWEDMVLNPDHPEAPPDEALSGLGNLAEFIKVDDYTLTMKFDAPAPLTSDRLAMWVNAGIGPRWHCAKHYLSQFNPKYNDAYTDYEEHDSKMVIWQNPDCPTMSSWESTAYEPDVFVTWDRNAYYYCVDPDGNQLPYLDGVDETRQVDNEAGKAAILAGQADFEWHQPFQLADVATLKESEAQMNMEARFIDTGSGTGSMFFFNQDYREDKYRELFRTPEFQRALSHAWNRTEAQKILYFNTGELTSGTLSPKAIEYQFNEEAKQRYAEWRDAWKEYDPEKSKELLDSIDIVDTTDDGWRNFPDGSELLVRFDAPGDPGTEHMTKNELLAKTWNEIGIQTMMNPIPSGADEMWHAGEKMSNCAWEVGDGPNHLVYPQWLVPIWHDRWAPMQGRMYSVRGTEKEGTETDVDPWERQPPRLDPEPGGPIEQLWKFYDQSRVEPDTIARHYLVWEMMKLHVNYGPFFMGCVANMPRLLIVNKDMRNVPTREDLATGGFGNPWITPHPAIWNPEIFYYENPEDH
jgi:peptide/nickel transport system substrate-binding protein